MMLMFSRQMRANRDVKGEKRRGGEQKAGGKWEVLLYKGESQEGLIWRAVTERIKLR